MKSRLGGSDMSLVDLDPCTMMGEARQGFICSVVSRHTYCVFVENPNRYTPYPCHGCILLQQPSVSILFPAFPTWHEIAGANACPGAVLVLAAAWAWRDPCTVTLTSLGWDGCRRTTFAYMQDSCTTNVVSSHPYLVTKSSDFGLVIRYVRWQDRKNVGSHGVK
jgi:hypothetical protein